jgi:hypothetical protein
MRRKKALTNISVVDVTEERFYLKPARPVKQIEILKFLLSPRHEMGWQFSVLI